MGDYVRDGTAIKNVPSGTDSYETWSAEQLAEFISKDGLAEYKECIIKHKITGKLAPLLSELDLKEMGISCIGDRLRFRQIVDTLKRKSRMMNRTRCIWEGEERLYFAPVMECICTGAGCYPADPSTYKLMPNYVKIRSVHPVRIGPIRLCCCNEYSTNNVDLTNVADVDVNGIAAPCFQRFLCCAPGKDIVNIEIRGYGGGELLNHKLILREDEGDRVASLIMNSVEECQRMERE